MEKDFFHLGVKAVIRSAIGEILLLQRTRNGTWDLPGGCMSREDVSEEQTLRREVKEEIGVDKLRIGRYLGMFRTDIRVRVNVGPDVGLIVCAFECSILPKAPLTISGEHTALDWCMPKEAARRLSDAKFPPELCALVMG